MQFETKVIHGGQILDKTTGAVMPPIYQTSTFVQSEPGVHQGYAYSRSSNPTRKALEQSIASLENAKYGLAFGSGMAAIDTVLKLLKPGDEVISINDLYGGTFRIFTKIYKKLGIKFHFVDVDDIGIVIDKITTSTKMIWIETPTNPLLNVYDVSVLAAIAKSHNMLCVVDNTFASPYLQKPLELGADIVMHSATKYLAGHSDVLLGALVVDKDELAEQLYFIQNTCGAVPGPMDCFLTLRGIKTLHLRMQRHCENAKTVAHFLKNHTKVNKVYWPGFDDCKGHDIAKNQMEDFGGMVSFELSKEISDESVKIILKKMKLFALAESLGGVESLCGHPASMSHGSMPDLEKEKLNISNRLIRLSVGVENVSDLVNDLDRALD